MNKEILQRYKRLKYIKLGLAVLIDLIGVATYMIPGIGESIDLFWAPISGLFIFMLFPSRKLLAFGGAVEEMIPFTDFMPTAIIAWGLDYIIDNKKTFAAFEKSVVNEQ